MGVFLTKTNKEKLVLAGSIGEQEFNVHINNSDVAYAGVNREKTVDAMMAVFRKKAMHAIEQHYGEGTTPA